MLILSTTSVGALSMPTTIDTGYYSCVGPSTECTVPTTKTTLNVQNMINDAGSVGNTSATFTAIRPTFVGFIDINAPTTATMAIPIHIRIEDGYGYNILASSTFYYIYLRGKLSTGSTIIITGGNYTEISSTSVDFIRIPTSIELTGASSILVSNVRLTRVRILNAVTNAAVTLSGGSSISIVGTTESFPLPSINVGGALSLTGGSSWSVTNSTLSIATSSNEAFWVNKATSISGFGSALIFSNNTLFYTTGGSAATNSESCLKFESTLSISVGGRLQASYNTLTAQGTAPLEFVLAMGTTTLSNDGGIEMTGNALNVTASGILSLFYFNAAVSISDSSINVLSNNVSQVGLNCLPFFFVSTLSLSSQGAVLVTNNTLSLHGQYVAIFYIVGDVIVDSGSSVSVASNMFYFPLKATGATATFGSVCYAVANLYLTCGGVFTVQANTFIANLVNFQNNAGLVLISCASTIDISHGAGLHIVDNNMQTTINASGSATLRLLEIGNLHVVESSAMIITGNNIYAVLRSTASFSQLTLVQLLGTASRVFVHNYSDILLRDNVFVFELVAYFQENGGMLFNGNTGFSLENASALVLVGNTVNTTQWNGLEVYGLWIVSLEATSNSTVLLQSNDISILFENATIPACHFMRIVTITCSNSTIEVSHHQVTLQAVAPSTDAVGGGTSVSVIFFWGIFEGLDIQGGASLFLLHRNTLESRGITTRLFVTVLAVFPGSSSGGAGVSMNESSTLAITNNVIEASWGTSYLLYIAAPAAPLTNTTITGGSTVYLQDNYFPRVMGNTASPYIRLCGLFSPAYLGGNSSIHITNNIVINDKGIARIFETSPDSPVTLDDVHVIIEGNYLELAGMPDTMKGTSMVNLFGRITQYFRLLFTDNVITISMSGEGTVASGFMFVITADVNTNYPAITEPLLTIQGNTVTGIGNNQTRGGYGCFIVFLFAEENNNGPTTPSEIPKVEMARVVNNSITTTNFNMTDIMRVNFTSYVDPYRVALTNNTVSSDTTSVSRLATISLSNATSMFSLSTCGNIVNNHMCHETALGTHSCVAYNPSQVFINDCDTSTLSPSYTLSLTTPASRTSTLTTSPTETPTASEQHTLTQTLTRSDSLYSTATLTLEPTPSSTHPLTTTRESTPTSSLPPSTSLPPTPTSTITISPSPSTTHPTATPSKSETVNTVNPAFLCKMGCAAVTSAHLAGVDVTTGPCGRAMIPFEATRDDAVANVVMHLSDDARQRINASVNVSEKVPLRTELLSDGKDGAAALVEMWGLREGAEYREVWLHVRRYDVTPLNRLDVRVALPAYCFLCRHDNDAVGGGLPWVDVSLSAPPAVLSGAALVVVTAGAAASSLLTTDLQTVAAMGMLGCAPRGDDSGESDNVRALVPVSLGDTCEDAVWGALITMAGVGLLSGVAVLIHRRVKGLPWTQTCAAVFSPTVFLSVWGMLQMGLVVCGGRLVQQGQGSVVVGCVGLLVGLAIVPCYIILANRVISRRCYRLDLTDKAPRNKAVRAVMYVVLPRYELNKEEMPACKAFTVVVGRTRYRWSGWAGIWVLQPVVMLMCVFAKGELCLGMYIASAACLGLLGLLHLIVRPHRTLLPNLLTCIALLINGGLVLVGSMLAYDPLDPVLRDISYHLSLAQTALTVIRTLLQVSTFIFMRMMRHSWFQAVSGDGAVVDKPEPVFEVIGWLDPPTKEGSTSVGLLTLEEHDEDDLSSISTEAVPLADRGGDVESYQHHHSDEDEMEKIDVTVVDAPANVNEVVVEEIPPTCPDNRRVQEELPPPPSPPRRPPVVVNHQIGRIGSHNQHLGSALGIDLPSSNGGDQGPSATSVIGGLESQGNVVVQPDEIDVLLQDFEGEVIIHNHVYNEGGMMVATSAGGARVQALDAESTAHIPTPYPPPYRPSSTTTRNLGNLITTICDRQRVLLDRHSVVERGVHSPSQSYRPPK